MHLVVAQLYLRCDHEELKGQNLPEQMLLLTRRDLPSQKGTVYVAAGAEIEC